MKTIFEKIISKELPADVVFENERILVIKDIYPVAPVHLLLIVKKPIANVQAMQPEDLPLLAEIGKIAQQMAELFEIEEGYRLLTNNGSSAGQTIFHLHFHLIGGRPLGLLG